MVATHFFSLPMTPPIVVLTDFFAVTNRALSYAAGLAVPLHAELVLLHARHDGLLSPGEYRSPGMLRSKRQTREAMHALAEGLPVPAEVEIYQELLPAAVAAAVRRHQPQLLVLGRPGTSAMPEDVVSRAAMELLRAVPCPLLIVPAVGWGGFPPRRLALALDGDDFQLYENQDIVHRLLTTMRGTLALLHVSDAGEAAATAAGHRALHSLRHTGLAPVPAEAPTHLVYHPDAAVGILQGAAELDADLLVVVARRHSLMGRLFHQSVAAQLIGESAIPVLVLPARE